MKPSNSTAVGLVALFALSTALQSWMIFHARLPAVDAVNFVAHAQVIERDGVLATLRTEPAPPLYPLAVLAVRGLASAVGGELSWALSAQIAAAIPLVLCIVPVLLIARQALESDSCSRTRQSSGAAPLPTPRTLASSATKDCSAAWVATLLFIVMTQVARMGAEALSDSIHLLLFCLALVAFGRAVGQTQPGSQLRWALLGGVLIGVALLARAEAWVLVSAVALAPLGIASLDWSTRWRRSWVVSTATIAGVALFAVAWLVPLGVTTPQAAIERLLARRGYVEEMPINLPAQVTATKFADSADWQLASGAPMQFGRKDPTVSIRFRGFTTAVARFTSELLQSWQYLVGLLAAVGIAVSRELWWRPTVSLHRTTFALFVVALVGFATQHGYLERRHLLPLVVLSLPWAGRGVIYCGEQLARRCTSSEPRVRWATAGATAVLLASTSLLPLHPGRAAHREAAEWLAAQPESGAVLDTVGHSALYTGRTTYRHEIAPAALVDPDLQFVVIESAELRYNSPRAATLRELVARFGTLAAKFEPPANRVGPVVHVYRWSPARVALHEQPAAWLSAVQPTVSPDKMD